MGAQRLRRRDTVTVVRERRYGRCPCSGTYEQRSVEVRLTVAGNPVVLTNVGQGACPNCGSRVYKAEILAALEGLMFASALPSS
jgi:YgiT-type zinc finger domain-containing protein